MSGQTRGVLSDLREFSADRCRTIGAWHLSSDEHLTVDRAAAGAHDPNNSASTRNGQLFVSEFANGGWQVWLRNH